MPIKKKQTSAAAKLSTHSRKAAVPILGLQNLDVLPQQVWFTPTVSGLE